MVQCSLDRFEIVYNGASGASYGVFLPDYPEFPNQKNAMKPFRYPAEMEI